MFFDQNMSTEAHKLIGISLSKIAQSRASRGGVSLHKNLLVATVLHKARYIFMEEAYQIVHGSNKLNNNTGMEVEDKKTEDIYESTADQVLAEELADEEETPVPAEDRLLSEFNEEWESQSETQSPPSYQAHIELTYLNLEKGQSLKRRRENPSWEVEEAVLSILPKRTKIEEATPLPPITPATPLVTATTTIPTPSVTDTDFTFFDETDFLSDESGAKAQDDSTTFLSLPKSPQLGTGMEMDRISSLVSIFSFANLTDMNINNLENEECIKLQTSHQDQCSQQAKSDHNSDALQPMSSFLAMTV